jgi:hypothetical protein
MFSRSPHSAFGLALMMIQQAGRIVYATIEFIVKAICVSSLRTGLAKKIADRFGHLEAHAQAEPYSGAIGRA